MALTRSDSHHKRSGSGGTAPKAYLHVLLFDERFKFDATNSFVQQVSSSTGTNTINKFAGNAVEVKKSGYAFVYISNEGDQLVYFDNLLLTHERGRILEESHYYPFGLTQSGLGSKALSFGGANNKFKYNGKEEQRQEFSDATGLDWLDYGARMYDAQIGRWHVIDPLSEQMRRHTVYNFAYENPVRFTDPDGMLPFDRRNEFSNTESDDPRDILSERWLSLREFTCLCSGNDPVDPPAKKNKFGQTFVNYKDEWIPSQTFASVTVMGTHRSQYRTSASSAQAKDNTGLAAKYLGRTIYEKAANEQSMKDAGKHFRVCCFYG